ncbi:uncharacterized protein [Amphiura filiformis]|uniref:uncharacterized protein isoform X3 n=1 Tax=Amphiura filiformis TaxID=82378 RepID=UPI003B213D20
MKMNLVVMVVGVFIMVCNADDSKTEDCIALCSQCVEVSDTLAHMGCTKHCEELTQEDDGKITCSKLTARNKGTPSLENEINAHNARLSELFESGDYSAMVEELHTDDTVYVIPGQAPRFGKEDFQQAWIDWSEANPTINRVSLTTTAFGENNGKIWADGIVNNYQEDALVGLEQYMRVYKRVNGTLLIYIHIEWDGKTGAPSM